MKNFATRYPVLFSIAIILAAELGLGAVNLILKHAALPQHLTMLVVEACFCAYVAWLLNSLRWWRESGFLSPVTRRAVLVFSPWLLLVILMSAEGGERTAGASTVIATAAFTLMVGFAEEGLLRGVALRSH